MTVWGFQMLTGQVVLTTGSHLLDTSGTAVSWRSNKQTTVALSTAEAEYVALASAAQEAVWMRQLTTYLTGGPTVVFDDNQAAIAMTKNSQFHGHSKHITIKYHFVRDKVNDRTLKIRNCPTTKMIAANYVDNGIANRYLQQDSHVGCRSMFRQQEEC